ncbi:MAG: site-specific integrase, partial [Methylobacillus glycogenes]|nr:site-specific integrase [Methylobacillus glycogenes]
MEQLQAYLDYLQFERGLSPLTVKHYRRDLDLLLSLKAELKFEIDLPALQTTHIRR